MTEVAVLLVGSALAVVAVLLALGPGWSPVRAGHPDAPRLARELAAVGARHDEPVCADPALRRAVQLVVGLLLYAASIATVVRSGLGAMPWDVLTLGLHRHTGASFGTITLLVSVVVLACWWPLRQRPGVGTVANAAVVGLAVDPILDLLGRLPPPGPAGQVLLLVTGIVTNATATALYLGAGLGPGPRDGLMTGLVTRTGRSVRLVKTSVELGAVAAGWLLGGTVGVGTLVLAVGVGPLVHALLPRLTVPRPEPARISG